jgi:prepilin-type N-terminal cleavage/methylation domain-containing protein
MKTRNLARRLQHGFSLIEMMLVVAIMGVISAGILSQMNEAQQRGYSEQVKLDNFQEARDFVDQFFRDINQIGYPSSRLVDTTSLTWAPALTTQATYAWANTYIFDNRMAIGLVSIDNDAVQFEGDMIGNGVVQSVIYKVNGSGSCALCLQRSQVDKVSGNPLPTPTGAQALNWGTEVNDVLNSSALNNGTTAYIFTYYKADGTPIASTSLPLDISTSALAAQTIASIKTIKLTLQIRNNLVIDPKTNQAIETNFEGEVSINNCSMATTGRPESCQ